MLLIVRPGVTTIQGAQLSKKNLEAVNARILGVVMNGYNVKKAGKKDGYYYSYSCLLYTSCFMFIWYSLLPEAALCYLL